jgi:uncharacterized membrane protein YoaK (UPF0700 family)
MFLYPGNIFPEAFETFITGNIKQLIHEIGNVIKKNSKTYKPDKQKKFT